MRPDHHGYVSDLALGWNNLAAVLLRQRRVDESSESHRRAIKIQQELVQRCPQVVAYRCDLAIAVNNFGRTHLMSERPQEALTLFQRAATILRQLQKEFGSQRDFLSSLGGVYFNMGMAYHHASEVSAAKDAFERSLQYQREACELGANDQQLRARLSEQTRLVQQFLQSG
jgi:tetratricopeptide (TPR) repeat protein